MRPRREDRHIGNGMTVTIDLTAGITLGEARSESRADVRALLWRKIEAIDPSVRGTEQIALEMLGWMRRVLAGEDRPVADAIEPAASWLARASALHQAAKAIERQIDALPSVAAVFDHNESLPTSELWPE